MTSVIPDLNSGLGPHPGPYQRTVFLEPPAYQEMNKTELVATARRRGLRTDGSKLDLIRRLQDADANQNSPADPDGVTTKPLAEGRAELQKEV